MAYAAKLHITIVPEIEMPGHGQAALAAYPQFSSSSETVSVGTTGGVYSSIYNAGDDKTFEFLQDVLTEVMALFPSKYIHIGGDEVPKGPWHNNAECQARMKSLGLKNEEELQSYFVKRIERFVASRGRHLIGWDEILEGGLAPGAAVIELARRRRWNRRCSGRARCGPFAGIEHVSGPLSIAHPRAAEGDRRVSSIANGLLV